VQPVACAFAGDIYLEAISKIT